MTAKQRVGLRAPDGAMYVCATDGSGNLSPFIGGSIIVEETLLWLQSISEVFSDSGITPATNTNSVQQWNDQSDGGRNVSQATAGNRPVFHTALPSLTFDGTDDCLKTTNVINNKIGSLAILFKTGSTAFSTRGAQVLVSSANGSSANDWFEIGLTSEGRLFVESNSGGIKHTVVGSDYLENLTVYAAFVVHDGNDYYIQINSTEQNPLTITNIGGFSWFGDVSGLDNIVIGATITSAGIVRPFQGDILEIKLQSWDITR